jgi:hypothetical protein
MKACCVVAMISAGLLVGCANAERPPRTSAGSWRHGAVWTFVTTESSGASSSFTFRVTNLCAKTCTSGDWRKLELISGPLPQLHDHPAHAAFSLEGSLLSIDLLAGWCDVDDRIAGSINGETFVGNRAQGGMMGRDVVGTVRGWRVK